MSRLTTAVAVAVVVVLVGACAGEPEDPLNPTGPPGNDDAADEEPEEPGTPTPDDPMDEGEDGDPPQRLEPDPPDEAAPDDGRSTALLDDEVQAAIDDAVERTGAARDEIAVITTELVTWPDGALGCPQPGQMYTMALVDGYRIVLEVDGQELAYHGEEGSPPFYCAHPSEPTAGEGRVTR